jgi:hypothetical protein
MVADAPRLARRTGGGDPASIALEVHLEDRRVVNWAVDSRKRHSGGREDARPFAKWMISPNFALKIHELSDIAQFSF